MSVNVKDYGAIGDGSLHLLSAMYGSLAAAQAVYPFVTSLSQSIDWAACQKALNTGAAVYVPQGVYLLSDSLALGSQTLFGDGVDAWDHLSPNATYKSQAHGSHLVFCGTGVRNKFAAFNTDERTSGGVLTNPDHDPLVSSADDATYALFNFHNEDASTSTPASYKLFSAAVYIHPYATNAAVHDLRVVLNYSGIDGYKSSSNTGLGDDWDVGIFNDNAAFVSLENVQCVGYWRIAGLLGVCVNDQALLNSYGGSGAAGHMYHMHVDRCIFQGWTGIMLRGGDVYKVVASDSTTVSVPWSDAHSFAASGSFKTPVGSYAYTSLTRVAAAGGVPELLQFNGVTPDPTLAPISSGPVRSATGSGLGGVTFYRTVVTGLDHASFTIATNKDVLNSRPSKVLEIDGNFRNICFNNCYLQSKEDVLLHAHNVDDLRFNFCQFEANTYKSAVGGSTATLSGGRMIASPLNTSSAIPTAAGNTKLTLDRTHFAPQVDTWPLLSRSSALKFGSSTGLFNPYFITHTDYQYPDSIATDIKSFNGKSIRMYPGSGGSVQVYTSAGGAFQVLDSSAVSRVNVPADGSALQLQGGTQLSFSSGGVVNVASSQNLSFKAGSTTLINLYGASGSFTPGSNGTQALGTNSAQWSNVVAKQLTLQPPSSGVAPAQNGQVNLRLTNDTTLAFIVRGSDGVLRTGNITLS